MKIESDFSVSQEHPCLPGHFPSEPIVPAVLLLDMLQSCLGEHIHDAYIHTIVRAKFLQPLKANTQARVKLCLSDEQGSFVIYNKQQEELAKGRFKYQQGSAND